MSNIIHSIWHIILVSVSFTILLLIPEKLARLKQPKEYYDRIRVEYEEDKDLIKDFPDKTVREKEVVKLINSSYILELGKTIDMNEGV